MASRYWVGGGSSTNWNATGNTNWAATSGGANNASVPTTTDDVFFDANSGSGASVLSAAITVMSVNFTGFTGTFTHNAFTLTINTGSATSLIFSAGMTYSPAGSTSIIAFTHTAGTADITSAGKRLAALTINGAGGTTRLLDALRVDTVSSFSALTLTLGTFNANGFDVTTTQFAASNSNVRTITMGSGTWTLGANAGSGTVVWNTASITNLTFNKNTANIVVPSNGLATSRTFAGGGLTFNDLTVSANSARGAFAITGTNTFANLSVGAGTFLQLPTGATSLGNAPTFTGTIAAPIGIVATTVGTAATLSIASGAMSLSWGMVRDITGSGGATFTATNSMDLGNNTGWSIAAPAVGLDAAAVRAAIGLASANLDAQIATLATPTNITAGTITTVTNLTNAPTSGDLTATMKASVTTAATAATPTAAAVTGNVGGNVTGSVGGVATGGITAASIAPDAIGASELAADAVTEIATGVWAATTRLLTAGTNIVLAKGTGVTGFNDLSAAQVNTEADTALADVGVTPTVTGRIDAAISTRLAGGSYVSPDNAGIAAVKAKTDNLPSDPADQSLVIAATDAIMTAVGDVPTNAELATALATADDAVLAAISALPTASANAAALLDLPDGVEAGLTLRQWLRIGGASLFGKASGLGTATARFRDKADSKDRIVATVDADGNRSAVTLDAA